MLRLPDSVLASLRDALACLQTHEDASQTQPQMDNINARGLEWGIYALVWRAYAGCMLERAWQGATPRLDIGQVMAGSMPHRCHSGGSVPSYGGSL